MIGAISPGVVAGMESTGVTLASAGLSVEQRENYACSPRIERLLKPEGMDLCLAKDASERRRPW